ncbi:hypothetical protein AB0E92_22480, partial [Streptomyces griseus]
KLYWFNAGLTAALLTAMIMELMPIPVLFLLGGPAGTVSGPPRRARTPRGVRARRDGLDRDRGTATTTAA